MDSIFDIQNFQDVIKLDLLAKQVVEGFITGLHKSPFHGFSVEFAEHRLYNKGESTKHIDWKLFARTEKLFVKRFDEETNLRCQIVIDQSSSMLFPLDKKKQNKLNFSLFNAAALIYLLRKQRDSVGLTFFSEQINLHTPSKLSTVHIQLLFSELHKLYEKQAKLNQKTNSSELLHEIADKIHKRSLVIIFSDMMEHQNTNELFAALQHLRYNKHEVILFHVKDSKYEAEFRFTNRPHRFVDLETGESIRLNPSQIRKKYVEAYDKKIKELKLRCGQYQIDLVEADIHDDFKNILIAYLIKRKKLH